MLAPGGRIVVFCPNRLYPFETHGIFLGKRYVFGNVPFVNYLPDSLRNRLVPHARTYSKRRLSRVYRRAGLRPIVHSYVFPGFDHVMASRKTVGKALKAALYPFENTGLRIFGLSHFVVLGDGSPVPKGSAPAPPAPARKDATLKSDPRIGSVGK
jgi:hypothetical protein